MLVPGPELIDRAAQADPFLAKLDATSRENTGVFRQVARRAEIAVELLRIDEKHVADIGESFAAAAVRLKAFRVAVVDAGEVANGVVVFHIGKPTNRHRTGIARIGIGRRDERSAEPFHHQRLFGVGELRIDRQPE